MIEIEKTVFSVGRIELALGNEETLVDSTLLKDI